MNGDVLKLVAIIAAITVLGVGKFGTFAATRLGISYGLLSIISFGFYGLAGYLAVGFHGSSAAAGGLVAFIDSLAWAISGGPLPEPAAQKTTLAGKLNVMGAVTTMGVLCGVAGGWIAGA